MLKLAVVGKDVSQSDSPAIHAFILGAWGKKCVYDKISVPPADFSRVAEALFSYDAFNVTIPFKGEIIPFLKELRGDARAFGAVNTVLTRERAGYNTDGDGFLAMLGGADVPVAGRTVLVLGAGGAGRSCIRKLATAGASVYVYEKDCERLYAAYREIGGFTPCEEVPLQPYDIAVNCTGVGMHDTVGRTPAVALADGTVEPAGEKLLSLVSVAADLIYVPAESEFLRIARRLGKRTVNGASMLFYQAYFGDCILCGRKPSLDEARSLWNKYREEHA